MKLPQIDVHSVVTLIGALALTAFIFVHPEGWSLLDLAGAYGLINTGQTIGNLGKGGQRAMQGGSVAPDQIVPPTSAAESPAVPLAPTPREETP